MFKSIVLTATLAGFCSASLANITVEIRQDSRVSAFMAEPYNCASSLAPNDSDGADYENALAQATQALLDLRALKPTAELMKMCKNQLEMNQFWSRAGSVTSAASADK